MDERTAARFWGKVEKAANGCWLWTGCLNEWGYGQFKSPAPGKLGMAHRFSYEQFVGPIPEGLVLDHLCRTPPCVNPAHLEPVTQRENLLRGRTFQAANIAKTHCPKGHPYSPENTYVMRGRRRCRECRRQESRESVRRRSEDRASHRIALGLPPYVEKRRNYIT